MTTKAPLVLASGSPRRSEILEAMGIPFEVIPSKVDESKISADHPRTFAIRAAWAKAHDVAENLPDGRWVLGADTVVTRDMVLYGKPGTENRARQMLTKLSGQAHDVITGVALVRSGQTGGTLDSETTRVHFRDLTAAEINDYIQTGEPMDKAGAYGIQGRGGDLINAISGDYFNVVGLPVGLLIRLLADNFTEYDGKKIAPPDRWR